MNVRLTILLVFVLVLFGGTFVIWNFWLRTEERTPDEDWMYRISEDDLYRIEVSNSGVDAVYTRNPGSFRWYIQGDPPVPVFNDKWAGTPLLLSGPRVNRTLTEVIENPAAYGLDPPASRVKVVDGAGQSFEFHMGGPTPDGSNQYTRLVGHSQLFTVPAIWAQVINRLALEPPYLRLFQLDLKEDNVVFVSVTDGDEIIEYGRRSDLSWVILGPPDTPEPQQAPVVESVWRDALVFLHGPRADEIVADSVEDPSEYGLDPPQTSVRMGKAAGADVKFFLGGSTPDGNHRYAMVDEEDPKLFAMRNDRAKRITDLVANPPYMEKPMETPMEKPAGATQPPG